MPATLLHVDSSPLGETSISRQLTKEFIAHWKLANPDGRVLRRDLNSTDLPVITAEWITAAFTPETSRTPDQCGLLSLSDSLVAELEAADEYVIGVPMHNFTVAAAARLWIDQIVRVGRTFAYVERVPTGLLRNKKASFLISSGGVYEPGTPMADFDFVAPYLRAIFGFIGVANVQFLTAGGAAAVTSGRMDRTAFLQPHLREVEQLFATA